MNRVSLKSSVAISLAVIALFEAGFKKSEIVLLSLTFKTMSAKQTGKLPHIIERLKDKAKARDAYLKIIATELSYMQVYYALHIKGPHKLAKRVKRVVPVAPAPITREEAIRQAFSLGVPKVKLINLSYCPHWHSIGAKEAKESAFAAVRGTLQPDTVRAICEGGFLTYSSLKKILG